MKLAIEIIQTGQVVGKENILPSKNIKAINSIKVKAGQHFSLISLDKEIGIPKSIRVRRQGDHLLVLDGKLYLFKLEDYFVTEGPHDIVGQLQDGQYANYLPSFFSSETGALVDAANATLDLSETPLVGGVQSIGVSSPAGVFDAWQTKALMGVGALAGVLAITSSSSNKTSDAIVDNNPKLKAPSLDAPTGTSSNASNDATPSINVGVVEAGNTVELIVDGILVDASIAVDKKGNTILTPTSPLSEGSHVIAYQIRSSAGVLGATSATCAVVIDTIAPDTPVNAPTLSQENGVVNGMELTGSATPGIDLGQLPEDFTAELFVDGVIVVAKMTINASGHRIYTPVNALSEGPHEVSYRLLDGAGNVSPMSPVDRIFVDSLPSDAPTNTPVLTQLTGESSSATNDATPSMNVGLLPDGTSAQLLVDGVFISTSASVDAEGNTILTPVNALREGAHEISYRIVDQLSGVSNPSPSVAITIDTLAPTAPLDPPNLSLEQSGPGTNIGTPSINVGVLAPSLKGKLFVDGVSIETMNTLDEFGVTFLTPTQALSDGVHVIAYQLVDIAGNMSLPSPSKNLVIDTIPPDTPENLALLDEITGGLEAGTNNSSPSFNIGLIPQDCKPELLIDSILVDSIATVDSQGNTILTPVLPLPDGTYDISYRIVDLAGNVSGASAGSSIVIDTVLPEDPAQAPSLEKESLNNITSSNTPGINVGVFPPGSAGILIIDGVQVEASQSQDALGNTILVPIIPLTEGSHEVSYLINDPAGTSSPSPSLLIEVDTVAPTTPELAPILTQSTGMVAEGITLGTNNPTPSFNVGQIEDGMKVELIVDGVIIEASASVDADLNVILTPTTPLPDGVYDVSYQIVDVAGNVSEWAPFTTIVIDTVAPDAPETAPVFSEITGSSQNVSNSYTPGFLIGVLPEGSAGELLVDGLVVNVISSFDFIGNTILTPVNPLSEGTHDVSYRIVDPAGVSPLSPVLSVVIDTVSPDVSLGVSDQLVNTWTQTDVLGLTSNQGKSAIASLSNGDHVLVWQSNGQDNYPADDGGVYARIYDVQGNPKGAEFLINTLHRSNHQGSPAVSALSDGGFVVTYDCLGGLDDNASGIEVKLYDFAGNVVKTEFLANATTSNQQQNSHVASFSQGTGGGFVVVWESVGQDALTGGNQTGVFAQIFDRFGAKVNNEFLVNSTVDGDQEQASIASLSGDRFVVTWTHHLNTGATEIRGQLYEKSGVLIGSEFLINAVGVDSYQSSSVTKLLGGGFVVTYEHVIGQQKFISGSVFSQDGLKLGNEFSVSSYVATAQSAPKVVGLLDEGFVITWQDDAARDGDSSGIYFQRYDASGNKVGLEGLVNGTTVGAQSSPNISASENGGFILTWEGPDGQGTGVYQKYFDALSRQIVMFNALTHLEPIVLYNKVNFLESNAHLTKVQVSFTTVYDANEDILLFNGKTVAQIYTDYGITASWDATNGTMNLSGLASVDNYNAVIALLQYDNLADASASSGERVISILSITDEAGNVSATDSTHEVVVYVNQTPPPNTIYSDNGAGATHWVSDGFSTLSGSDSHHDIALLMGANQLVKLSQFTSVELIDLTGLGSNTLTVALKDALDNAQGNSLLELSGKVLKVLGDADDQVSFESSVNGVWQNMGDIVDVSSNKVYSTYHHTSLASPVADLWIQKDVNVTIL